MYSPNLSKQQYCLVNCFERIVLEGRCIFFNYIKPNSSIPNNGVFESGGGATRWKPCVTYVK